MNVVRPYETVEILMQDLLKEQYAILKLRHITS